MARPPPVLATTTALCLPQLHSHQHPKMLAPVQPTSLRRPPVAFATASPSQQIVACNSTRRVAVHTPSSVRPKPHPTVVPPARHCRSPQHSGRTRPLRFPSLPRTGPDLACAYYWFPAKASKVGSTSGWADNTRSQSKTTPSPRSILLDLTSVTIFFFPVASPPTCMQNVP
ncbi:hypothetical protein EDD86DRAFT_45580 [Gorgonomyces haynaldii]|nr:hypothetical protein EDD86DRAFT_45580 [Gorgonomyces haynaldii]